MSEEIDWDREWERVLEQMPPLHRAAWTGDIHTIRTALDAGAEVNSLDPQGYPALIGAAAKGHEETVRLLLERGADPNRCGPSGGSALMSAAGAGHLAIVRLLIEGGADVNVRGFGGETALLRVSGSHTLPDAEQRELVRLIATALIEAGADVNASNRRGTTPLMHYMRPGCLEIIRLLLERGANVNARDADGKSVMLRAAVFTDTENEIISLLVAHGGETRSSLGFPLFARRDAPLQEIWDCHWARVLEDPFERGFAQVGVFSAFLQLCLEELRRRRAHRLLLTGNGCSLLPRVLEHLGFAVTVVDFSSVANQAVEGTQTTPAVLSHFLPEPRKSWTDWFRNPLTQKRSVAHEAVPGGSLTLVTADILIWEAEAPFDCLYDDRLAMELPPECWPNLAERYRRLLGPNGLCVVETINLGGGIDGDPEVRAEFEAAFTSAGFRHADRTGRTSADKPTVRFIHGSG